MIDIRDLAFGYEGGPTVLSDVDLSVESGSVFALMGPNGAGKTTLLKLVAELLDPDTGSIETGGVVGFAPENPDDGLFADSVADEVAFFPRNRGLDVTDRVEAALADMGVSHLRDRVPQTLAAGEKRRVSLAAVLSGDPAVVALDEPTSGIDGSHLQALGDRLQAIDRTVVVATHDADFARRWADEVAIVSDGTVATTGEADAILGDPVFDFEAVGIRPPGAVAFARERGWETAPQTAAEAADRLDEEGA